MKLTRRLTALFLTVLLSLTLLLPAFADGLLGWDEEAHEAILAAEPLDEDGYYYSKLEVAAYLYQYGVLPGNFITKRQAKKLGWSGGSVERYKEGGAIGGDVYRNLSEALPALSSGTYYECDIDTLGEKKRGARRIIFTMDGYAYYTEDHYESFVQLMGGEE